MLKKVLVLGALFFVIFVSVEAQEKLHMYESKKLIEQATGWYVTDFSMMKYEEIVSGDRIYTRSEIIFNGDGVKHWYELSMNSTADRLFFLRIDNVLIYGK